MKCIQENLESTKLKDRAKTMQMDVLAALSRLNGEWKFEYIFMDPPYNHEWEKQVLEFLTDTTLLADDRNYYRGSIEGDRSVLCRRTGLFHNKRKDV